MQVNGAEDGDGRLNIAVAAILLLARDLRRTWRDPWRAGDPLHYERRQSARA